MPHEHVEVVRVIAQEWNAGREVRTEYFDPSVELETPISSVSGQPYRGYAGIEEFTRDNTEQFSKWELRLDDVRAIDDKVIAIGSARGRGRASGIEFDFPAAIVAQFGSDHRISRARIYADVDAARRAVGLDS